MKIDLHKLTSRIIAIAGPIVLAAVAHKVATGKLDVKAAALDAVTQALAGRGV